MNNLLLYCGLVDARISASENDLPVIMTINFTRKYTLKRVPNIPNYSGPKIADHLNLSPSLDLTLADWSRNAKTIVLTVLENDTVLYFQMGPDLSDEQVWRLTYLTAICFNHTIYIEQIWYWIKWNEILFPNKVFEGFTVQWQI